MSEAATHALHLPDYAVIAGYFIVMVAIGLYCSSRIKSLRDFFGGSGRVPWWLAGISFWMSSFSALSFVIYSEMAYKYGWVAITIGWTIVPSVLVSGYLFAARWRRAAKTSALEYIEQRFGGAMRQWLAWLTIPLRVIDNGLKLFAIGTLVSGTLGFPIEYAIIFSSLIMLIYTFLGGLWAILVADFVQAAVLLVAVLVLLPLALSKVGGLAGFMHGVSPGHFHFTADKFNGWYLAAFMFMIMLNYSSSWALVQRYYIVKNDREARKVSYLVAILQVFTPLILFLPAIAATVFLPGLDAVQSKQVYPLICKALLPIGMIGMLISALFASTMAMVSGEWNAIAAVLTNDVYKRLINPNATHRQEVTAGRLATTLIGLACMGIAFVIYCNQKNVTLFEIMVGVFAVFIPATALPMLAGLLSRRVSNLGGLLGVLLGIGVGVIVYVLGQKSLVPDGLYVKTFAVYQVKIVIGVAVTVFGMILGTLLRPSTADERRKIDQFFDQLEAPDHVEDPVTAADNRPPVAPLTIIGLSVGALGLLLFVVMGLYLMFSHGPVEHGGLSLGVGFVMIVLGGSFCLLDRIMNPPLPQGADPASSAVTDNKPEMAGK